MARSPLTEIVLDASAVLACKLGEPGADRVRPLIAGARLNTVNLTEVASRLIDRGAAAAAISGLPEELGCRIIPFDIDLALGAAILRNPTRRLGLSLGDRACLALAQRERLPVLTADRAWLELDVGVEVVLIR